MTRLFPSVVVVLSILVMTPDVFAQATRTWVSGVGDDANPCSRTAPCKTFAGAISKTAAGGVISVLDPGGFGALTITKAITVDGTGIDGSILASGSNGIVVNAGATDHVTLRNLTIYGTGSGLNGVRVIGSSGHVTIEHCVISGFMIGIDYNAAGQLYVYDTFAHHNSQFGAVFRQGRGNFEGVRFENNGLDGLRVAANGVATVKGSSASGHSNIGFSAIDTGSKLTLEASVINNNVFGIGVALNGTIWVSNSVISNSTSQGLYREAGSSLITFGNNRLVNNPVDGTFSGSAMVQ